MRAVDRPGAGRVDGQAGRAGRPGGQVGRAGGQAGRASRPGGRIGVRACGVRASLRCARCDVRKGVFKNLRSIVNRVCVRVEIAVLLRRRYAAGRRRSSDEKKKKKRFRRQIIVLEMVFPDESGPVRGVRYTRTAACSVRFVRSPGRNGPQTPGDRYPLCSWTNSISRTAAKTNENSGY